MDRFGLRLGRCSEGSTLGLLGCRQREVGLQEQPAVVVPVLQDGGEATSQGEVPAVHAGLHAGPAATQATGPASDTTTGS
jgi:hypothetical protein